MLSRSRFLHCRPRVPAEESISFLKSHYNSGIGRICEVMYKKGKGSYVWDTNDRKYLDFIAGIGVCNFGHCHEYLVKQCQDQLENLWHGQINTGFHQPMEELVEKLLRLIPNKQLDNFLFVSTGSEAVEGAIKLSRAVSGGRPCLAACAGGYHGRTLGAASLTTSKYSYGRAIKPFLPGIVILPLPYHRQMKVPFSTPVDQLSEIALAQAEDVLTQQCHGEEVAMLIVEPVLGEGGYVPLPLSYWKGLRELTRKYGILLAADEIQSGFGRTGSLFYSDQFYSSDNSSLSMKELGPDIITFAKGVANGLPLAGLVTRKEFGHKQTPLTQGGTYAGNCIACAAASGVCDILEKPHVANNGVDIFKNVQDRSKQLFDGLLGMTERHNFPVVEIRGRGLMVGMEFDCDKHAGVSAHFKEECFKRGLMMSNTGKFECVRLIPPLTVSESEVNESLGIMEEALTATFADKKFSKKSLGKVSGFFEDGKLPGSDVPLRWATKFN